MQRRIVARTFGADPARVHHHQPVGQQRQRQVVQNAEHGRASPHLALHQAQQRHLVGRVEVGGGLVEQEQRRVDRERPRQQHALALAARKLVQPALLPRRAFGVGQRLVDARFVVRCRRAEQAERRQPAEVHDFAHGQLAAGLALLRQPRDPARALAQRPLRERHATELHRAGVDRLQAGEHPQQGRLAGPVRADDGGPAGCHCEAHVAQRLGAAERHAHVLSLQARHASRRRCSSQIR